MLGTSLKVLGGWVVGGTYTKFSVLLWATALVLAKAQAEQFCKLHYQIIEIGTFLKIRDPPSVFKIPKLKLGHFWGFFLPLPPPFRDILTNFLIFLF